MSVHHGLPAQWVSGTPGRLSQQARYAATGTAALTALLYVLSCTVGSIELGFGLAMGVAFAAAAALLFSSSQRLMWELVALLDAGAIVGYFIFASSRDPVWEAWGITIKAVQVVLFAVLCYVIIGDRRAPGRG